MCGILQDIANPKDSNMVKWFNTFDKDEDWMKRDEDSPREMIEEAESLGFIKVHKIPKGSTGWNVLQLLPKGRLWLKKLDIN